MPQGAFPIVFAAPVRATVAFYEQLGFESFFNFQPRANPDTGECGAARPS
jgi:hypothetical protein